MRSERQISRIVAVLTRAGGFGDRPLLRTVASDHAIRAAVECGAVLRPRRGSYALPTAADHLARAHQMSATLSHASAAMHWGWKVKFVPERAGVTVGRHRTVRKDDQSEVRLHWKDLAERDVVDGVTEPTRTVLDCALDLPFDVALAVADSALRSGLVQRDALVQEAGELRGRGAARARRVARAADRRAANPFESCLRAIALEFAEFRFVPQLSIDGPGMWVAVDLGDPVARLVLEADSFEHHGTRRGLVRDCARYDELTVRGWTVLRFTWEHVMLHPDYVRWCLGNVLAGRAGVVIPAAPRTA